MNGVEHREGAGFVGKYLMPMRECATDAVAAVGLANRSGERLERFLDSPERILEHGPFLAESNAQVIIHAE